MSLYIETEGDIDFPFDIREIAEMTVDAALEYIDCPYEAEVNLLITHDDEIHEMNREHRGIDRATDVLSFPMLEFENPGDFSGIDEEMPELFDPETGELMLGDIDLLEEPDKELTLVLNSYRATGTGGYGVYRDAEVIERYRQDVQDLLIEYFRKEKDIKVPEKTDFQLIL